MLAQPLAQCFGTDGARTLRDDISSMEQQQGRNASYVVTGRQLRFRLGVNLQETKLGFELAGDALENRCHHLARPAPLRPEIDHDRNVVALDMSGEAVGGNRCRMSCKQPLVALAAFRLTSILAGRNTVDARAMWTNDVGGFFAHERMAPGSTSMRGQRLLAVGWRKRVVEIGQILRRQTDVERATVLANVLRPARLRYGAHAVLAQHPGQGHLCRCRAEPRRNCLECDVTQHKALLDR